MKANELRIGCTYLSTKFNTPAKCTIEDLAELDNICQGAGLDEDIIVQMFKPIPLTEEWFKSYPKEAKEWYGNGQDYQPQTSKTEEISYYLGNDIYIVFQNSMYKKNINDKWNIDNIIFIRYNDNSISLYKDEMHVLQNLYHALVGWELTIK